MNRLSSCVRLTVAALTALGGLTVTGAAVAACKVDVLADLPVTVTDMRATLPVKVNGVPAHFMLDSGGFFGLIPPSSASEFGLKLESLPEGLLVTGSGGSAAMSVAKVKAFNLAGLELHNVEFMVGGSEVGGDRSGTIGENILGFADTEFDLAGGAIRLMRPHDCGGRGFAYWDKTNSFSILEISPTQGWDNKIAGYVTVNGVRLHAWFDTGAPTSYLSHGAAVRAGIDLAAPGVVDGGYDGGIGRHRYRTWIAPVDVFKIGDEEIRHTHLRVSADTNDTVDMLIGMDFFLSHRIYVANSQHRLYFTYNGGPVFNLLNLGDNSPLASVAPPVGKPAAAAPEPVDADGFGRRGAALLARKAYDPAIADLTHAIALAPANADYVFARARAYLGAAKPFLAMADLDQTLKLRLDDVPAHILRAQVRLYGRDTAGALTDLDAADHAAAPESDERFTMAGLYESADALPRAIAQLDLWIKVHPADGKRGQALNDRCWARAQLGEGLDLALNDCNAALRADPKNASFLDSRGLMFLRQGAFDKAIADYDAALAQNPKIAWSLYGRGLAKLHKGLTAAGNADIAAATALQPGLPAEAKAHGVGP